MSSGPHHAPHDDHAEDTGPDAEVLATITPRKGRRRLIWGVVIATVVAAAWGVSAWMARPPSWVTLPATEAPFVERVTAVGPVEPVETVEVSSRQSGEVTEVYVDVNDVVTRGQPMARLDVIPFEQDLEGMRASWEAAVAQVEEAKVQLRSAEQTHARVRRLHDQGVGTDADLDQATTALDAAQASLRVARSQVAKAKAGVETAARELEQSTIASPIDGIVTRRMVEPGQSIVSALNANALFEVASDLSELQLRVEVEEVDVGKVAAGQHATFTVPAWPGRTFEAEVQTVDPVPVAGSAVVVYAAELSLDNVDGLLRPGMTATAEIDVADRGSLLRVPSEAIRFEPDDAEPAEGDRVFVLRDGAPVAVPVEVVGVDGARVAVQGEALSVGDPVITGTATP